MKEQFEKIIKDSQQPSYEEHVEWCMEQAYELGQQKAKEDALNILNEYYIDSRVIHLIEKL